MWSAVSYAESPAPGRAGQGTVRTGMWAPVQRPSWEDGLQGENNRVPLKRTERVRFAF